MHQMWRLSEAGPRNLGLACTDDGLLLGRTSLVERRDGRFVVRARGEIERLLKCAYDGEPPVDRLMSGLARVASALNANDQCLARIAAVHLQMPDLASAAVRDALAAEDSLIKYARDEGAGAANWNPALHPRTGTPPNPGWFAPTGGASHDAPSVRVAENDDPTRRSDGSPDAVDHWVHLPPAKRIDELGDFLEWLANAKPEDEADNPQRKSTATGGASATFTQSALSTSCCRKCSSPGLLSTSAANTRADRQLFPVRSGRSRAILRSALRSVRAAWSRAVSRGRGQECPAPGSRRLRKRNRLLKAQRLLPASHWPKPTQPHGNLDGPNEGAISKSNSGARFMRIFRSSTRFPTELPPALNQSILKQPRIKMPPV